MNRERIETAIRIMERVRVHELDMIAYQSPPKNSPPSMVWARTEQEMHACGNTACFAGWIAVSPEFWEDGGYVSEYSGAPVFRGCVGYQAIAEWLELPEETAESLVHGSGDMYPVPFAEVEPRHVIVALKALLQ